MRKIYMKKYTKLRYFNKSSSSDLLLKSSQHIPDFSDSPNHNKNWIEEGKKMFYPIKELMGYVNKNDPNDEESKKIKKYDCSLLIFFLLFLDLLSTLVYGISN
jgi:hypothetical protein